MYRLIGAGLAALMLLVSCNRPVQGGRDTIELVKAIAADSSSPEHVMLSGFRKPLNGGGIYIIGSPASCVQLGSKFLECDMFENARGNAWGDGLKDFAGEEFDYIADTAFAPYEAFAAKYGADKLREATVRLCLSALKPNCNVSIYDLDGNQEKTPAKLIILADPWLLGHGKADVDTLFTMTGCNVPVFSPQELMFDQVLGGDKKNFRIGVMSDSTYAAKGLYTALFDAKVKQYDVVGARCFEAAAETEGGTLLAFLDRYAESGGTEPLEALLVDDLTIDIHQLQAELKAIRDFNKEEFLRYGKLVSPDFKIISSSELTMTACYREMRSSNLFTHRIARPVSREFTVRPMLDGNEMQYLLIPSENVQN